MEDFVLGSKIAQIPGASWVDIHLRHRLTAQAGPIYPPGIRTAVDAVRGIPGVDHAHIDGYQLTIFRGRAFAWDELLPKIKDVLIRYLPADHD